MKAFIASIFWVATALANPLIQDVQNLRNSLPAKDPARPSLTLRLADLLFDEALSLSTQEGVSEAAQEQAQKYRKQALTFYKQILDGNEYFAPASGEQKTKIQFQMARLYSDMHQQNDALRYWEPIAAQSVLFNLQREAHLRLAEALEERGDSGSLEKADTHYREALRLCDGTDACSYAHYKRGWLLRHQNRLPQAIESMRLAMFDSKGQLREEALRDYVLLLGLDGTQVKERVVEIEALGEKLNRPLLEKLSDAYYAAGNKPAGTQVLSYVQEKRPSLARGVRVLEEWYGVRQWEKFGEARSALEPLVLRKEEATDETEKVLRRLLIQLDGERVTSPEHNEDFRAVTSLYLALFPASASRLKMMEGWLAAEPRAPKKIEQLKHWLTSPTWQLSQDEELKLREFRASIAQKEKNFAVVAEEMKALSLLSPDPKKAREYRFYFAAALFENNQWGEALPVLQEIAKPSKTFDPLALKGQKLALEILAKKIDYVGLIAQSESWLQSVAVINETKTALSEMRTFVDQANFEIAVGGGESTASLDRFHEFCKNKKFLPKSCENARVLAAKLRDQEALLSVLKLSGKEAELASEYEASGYFSEAAHLYEKALNEKSDITDHLKVSLLYELGQDLPGRNRVLDRALAHIRATKKIGLDEGLLMNTLKDAERLSVKELSLPWSLAAKEHLANILEEKGQGTAETKRILLDCAQYAGKSWSRLVLAKLDSLNTQQQEISFYGKNGQRKFEKRLAALKKYVGESQHYLGGADTGTRAVILKQLVDAHTKLGQEILSSPIPESLDENAAQAVKASLAQLAQPFQEKVAEYEKWTAENVEAPKPIEIAEASTAAPAAAPAAPAATSEPIPDLNKALATLHRDPTHRPAIDDIRRHYEHSGNTRLASYFWGRLKQMEKAPQ